MPNRCPNTSVSTRLVWSATRAYATSKPLLQSPRQRTLPVTRLSRPVTPVSANCNRQLTSGPERALSEQALRLRAGFNFETEVLPRWRLAANQLANYIVVTVQITGRKLLGIQHPELLVIREMHREHLKKALNGNNHH